MGGYMGKTLQVDLVTALDSYYVSMGWNLHNGLPGKQTLDGLNLGWM